MASGLGIDLPQDVTGTEHGRLLRTFAAGADAAGYDSLWVTEASTPEVLEPLAALHQLRGSLPELLGVLAPSAHRALPPWLAPSLEVSA